MKEDLKIPALEDVWNIYNFVNAYKYGSFGLMPLSEALQKYYLEFDYKNYEGGKYNPLKNKKEQT